MCRTQKFYLLSIHISLSNAAACIQSPCQSFDESGFISTLYLHISWLKLIRIVPIVLWCVGVICIDQSIKVLHAFENVNFPRTWTGNDYKQREQRVSFIISFIILFFSHKPIFIFCVQLLLHHSLTSSVSSTLIYKLEEWIHGWPCTVHC